MTGETSLWHMNEAEYAEWHKRRTEALNASPIYQANVANTKILVEIFTDMVYPLVPKPPSEPRPWNRDELLFYGLNSYGESFHSDHSHHNLSLGSLANVLGQFRDVILDACIEACWPFKLGASLYIYQQMVDRALTTEPSFGKAQWLLSNAPLSPTSIITRKDGGSPEDIGRQWKRYYAVAHYWAAFAVLTERPLEYQQADPLKFVCSINPQDFFSLAAAFLEFRQRVDVNFARRDGQKIPFIKQGLDDYRCSQLIEAEPRPPLEIPNLLSDSQWGILTHYRTSSRPNRKGDHSSK